MRFKPDCKSRKNRQLMGLLRSIDLRKKELPDNFMIQAMKYINQGADINIQMSGVQGYTLLMIAVMRGSVMDVRKLIDQGANANILSRHGYTDLHLSINRRKLEIVLALIGKTSKEMINRSSPKNNQTPLMIASDDGDLYVVNRLIKHGARVDEIDHDKRTALFQAVKSGHENVFDLLIESGADITRLRKGGASVMTEAAISGCVGIAKKLFKLGFDVNQLDNYGRTPIFYAAGQDHLEMLQFLIRSGSNVNAQNRGDRIPLINSQINCIRALIEAGADINAQGVEGVTALIKAVKHGDIEKVRLLIELKADPFIKDEFGSNALNLTKYITTDKPKDLIIDLLTCYMKRIEEKNINDYRSGIMDLIGKETSLNPEN
ncbi:MAG: ankyrin repeat domain-containing protein [Methyloprofundus sp.]|nr:ankyrin repeat domain-containing protein [Methyloprofundus sp.]